LVRSDSADPNAANNVAVVVAPFDNAAVAGRAEDCSNGIDDDCNGRIDCMDPQCTNAARCTFTDVVAGGAPPASGWPPPPFPLTNPTAPGVPSNLPDPLSTPPPDQQCLVTVLGHPEPG